MGILNKAFFKIGYFSASNPGTACFCSFMLTLVCSLGFINYKLTVSYSASFNVYHIEQPIRLVGRQDIKIQY